MLDYEDLPDDWEPAERFLKRAGIVRNSGNWLLRPGNRDPWIEAGVLIEVRTRPDAKRATVLISPSRFFRWQQRCSIDRVANA